MVYLAVLLGIFGSAMISDAILNSDEPEADEHDEIDHSTETTLSDLLTDENQHGFSSENPTPETSHQVAAPASATQMHIPDRYILGSAESDVVVGTSQKNIILADGTPLLNSNGGGNTDLFPADFLECAPDTIDAGAGDDIIRFSVGDDVTAGIGDDLLCFYASSDPDAPSATIRDFEAGDHVVIFVPFSNSEDESLEIDVVSSDGETSVFLGAANTASIEILHEGSPPLVEAIEEAYDASQNIREFLAEYSKNADTAVFAVRY